jgi:hypothetical protein
LQKKTLVIMNFGGGSWRYLAPVNLASPRAVVGRSKNDRHMSIPGSCSPAGTWRYSDDDVGQRRHVGADPNAVLVPGHFPTRQRGPRAMLPSCCVLCARDPSEIQRSQGSCRKEEIDRLDSHQPHSLLTGDGGELPFPVHCFERTFLFWCCVAKK